MPTLSAVEQTAAIQLFIDSNPGAQVVILLTCLEDRPKNVQVLHVFEDQVLGVRVCRNLQAIFER